MRNFSCVVSRMSNEPGLECAGIQVSKYIKCFFLRRNLLALRKSMASTVNIINEDDGDKLVSVTQGHFRHLWKMKAKKQWKLKKNTTESGCEEDNEHVLLGTILWTFNGNTQYLVLQQRFCTFPFGHLSLCHFLPFSWLKFLRHTLEPRNEKRLQNEGYIFYTNNSLYSEFSQNDYKVWCVYLSQNDTLQGMFSKLTGKVLSKLWIKFFQ